MVHVIPFQLEAVQRGLIFDQNIDLGVEIPVSAASPASKASSDHDSVVSEATYEAPDRGRPLANDTLADTVAKWRSMPGLPITSLPCFDVHGRSDDSTLKESAPLKQHFSLQRMAMPACI